MTTPAESGALVAERPSPIPLRRAFGVSLLLVLSACFGGGTSPVTETATVPVPPPAPTQAGTSEVADDVTTTTTEPRLPPGRTGVVVSEEGVLGWWDGSNWVQAQGSAPLAGGESYQVVAVQSDPTIATGSEPLSGCDLIEGSVRVRLSPDFGDEEVTGMAVTAPWDVTPHPVTSFAPPAEYAEFATELLDSFGLEDADPSYPQLFRIDVEGDGVDEVFGVIERSSNPGLNPAPTGDYSIAFHRRVGSDDTVEVTVLESFIVEAQPEGSIQDLTVFRFQAFADADGDGIDEVGLGWRYYEGSGIQLYDRVDDREYRPVIGTGCGV